MTRLATGNLRRRRNGHVSRMVSCAETMPCANNGWTPPPNEGGLRRSRHLPRRKHRWTPPPNEGGLRLDHTSSVDGKGWTPPPNEGGLRRSDHARAISSCWTPPPNEGGLRQPFQLRVGFVGWTPPPNEGGLRRILMLVPPLGGWTPPPNEGGLRLIRGTIDLQSRWTPPPNEGGLRRLAAQQRGDLAGHHRQMRADYDTLLYRGWLRYAGHHRQMRAAGRAPVAREQATRHFFMRAQRMAREGWWLFASLASNASNPLGVLPGQSKTIDWRMKGRSVPLTWGRLLSGKADRRGYPFGINEIAHLLEAEHNALISLVIPAGFEPATLRLGI